MRRLLLILLAFALAATLGLVLLHEPGGEAGPRPPAPEDDLDGLPPARSPNRPADRGAPEPTGPPGAPPTEESAGWVLVRVRERGSDRPVVMAGVTVRQGQERKHFLTSRDGTVWIGPLRPGLVQLHFAHGRFVDRAETRFVRPAADDGKHQEIPIELVGAWPIRGRLVTTSGEPGKGHLTARPLQPSNASVNPGDLHARLDKGRFEFPPLLPGRYELELTPPDGEGRAVPCRFTVAAGDEDLVLEYELVKEPAEEPDPEPDHGVLRVRVITPDGGELESVALTAVAAETRYPEVGGGTSSWYEHPAGFCSFEEGVVGLKVLRPGALVWIRAARGRSISGAHYGDVVVGPFLLAPGEMEVTLPPGRRIAGRILTAEGRPAAEVMVLLARTHVLRYAGYGLGAVTDAEGRFAFDGLGEGAYHLYLRRVGTHLPEKGRVITAGTEDLEIRLRRGVVAQVRVLGASGEPVVGARVGARVEATGSGVPWSIGRSSTDWKGVARLDSLDPEATYVLTVEDECSGMGYPRYTRKGWKPVDTTITLPAPATISGVVLNTVGEPVAYATVVWTDEEGWWATTTTASHGSFELRVRADTAGTLQMRPPGSRRDEAAPSLSAAAGDRDLVLRQVETEAPVLEVAVTNWPARAGGDAEIRLADGLGTVSEFVRKGRGSFQFAVPATRAPATLEIVCPDHGLAVVRSGLRTDAGPIEVTLREGARIEGRLLLPEGAAPHSVIALKGSLHAAGRVRPDGGFVVEGLTPGTWTVIGRAFRGGTVYAGEVRAEAGGRIDIELVEEE